MNNDWLDSIAELISQGHHAEAIAQLQPILKADRDDADAWWLLANALEHDPTSAQRALKQVLRLRPNDPKALALLTPTSAPAQPKSGPTSNLLFGGLLLLVVVLVGAILVVLLTNKSDEPATQQTAPTPAITHFLCNGADTTSYHETDIRGGTPASLLDDPTFKLHSNAGGLIYGQTVQAALPKYVNTEGAVPSHIYRFDGQTGDHVLITLNWSSTLPQYVPSLTLLTPDGLEVFYCPTSGSNPRTLATTLPQAGSYWLLVDGVALDGSYTLTLGQLN